MSFVLSAALVLLYLVSSLLGGGLENMLTMLAFCIIPTACIWFPEALADYTGGFLLDSITQASPPLLVWLLGWFVLLLPLLTMGYWWVEGVPMHGSGF